MIDAGRRAMQFNRVTVSRDVHGATRTGRLVTARKVRRLLFAEARG